MMEVVGSTTKGLRNLRGKVFHVIAGDDHLLRFRVQDDGQLSLDRQFRSLNLDDLVAVPRKIVNMPRRMLEAGKEAGELVREVGQAAKDRGRRKWRKVVTGDPEKRIRDHMKEVPQVKMMDKLSFTFGVLSICGLEWLALRHGELFPFAYYFIMSVLIGLRFYLYKQEKYELFMLDFCYFMNISVMVQTAFFPDWMLWFKANYVMTLGPLMVAIIIWKNSLVFHSLDKLTSFYLHALPPLTMHLYRFGLMKNVVIHVDDTMSFTEAFVVPLGLYFSWQIGYSLIMEGVLASTLQADEDIVNSLRYLAKDKKNGFRNLIIAILESAGVKGKDEVFDPDTLKTKIVFVVSQLVYTVVTILPTPFLYRSYYLSLAYFLFVFGWGTWNGASYYIEVFSERYKLKFIVKEEETADNELSSETDDDDESRDQSFEEALDQLDQDEHSELCQTILQIIKDADESAEAEAEADTDIDQETGEKILNLETEIPADLTKLDELVNEAKAEGYIQTPTNREENDQNDHLEKDSQTKESATKGDRIPDAKEGDNLGHCLREDDILTHGLKEGDNLTHGLTDPQDNRNHDLSKIDKLLKEAAADRAKSERIPDAKEGDNLGHCLMEGDILTHSLKEGDNLTDPQDNRKHDLSKIDKLLKEAAAERSTSSSESTGTQETLDSEQSWDDLSHP